MKYLFLPLILLGCICSSFSPHDFHVSITEVEQNAENGRFEFTVKIFTDDLEQALMTEGTEKLLLGEEMEHEQADTYLTKYVQKRLLLTCAETEIDLVFIGKEVELDATWMYFESSVIPICPEVSIQSFLLTDVFEDQQNIIKARREGERKSLILHRDQNSGVITWN